MNNGYESMVFKMFYRFFVTPTFKIKQNVNQYFKRLSNKKTPIQCKTVKRSIFSNPV